MSTEASEQEAATAFADWMHVQGYTNNAAVSGGRSADVNVTPAGEGYSALAIPGPHSDWLKHDGLPVHRHSDDGRTTELPADADGVTDAAIPPTGDADVPPTA